MSAPGPTSRGCTLPDVPRVPSFGLLFLLALVACVAPPAGDDDDSSAWDDDDTAPDDDDSALDDDDSAPDAAARYLVLAADSLAGAADAWAAYREALGVEVMLRSEVDGFTPEELRLGVVARLTELAADAGDAETIFLLILGDAPGPSDPVDGPGLIPTLPCTSSLGPCYTDNRYGDLDGDAIPDVAVGRLPARTEEQALTYLERVRGFEQERRTGLWNRRLFVYAGGSGFGELFDGLAETLAFESLARTGHAFDLLGAWDNPASFYYFEPFEQKVLQLFEDGALAGMYIGHGSAAYTDGLSPEQLAVMQCGARSPFVFFFACSNGEYAHDSDSISEAVLWTAEGPIASFGAVGTTHPYANAVLPYEAWRAIAEAEAATFGEATLRTKRALIEHDDEVRELARSYAVLMGVTADELPGIEREHLDQYNLFGDPALSTGLPGGEVLFDPVVEEEGGLRVSGEVTGLESGTAWVTLEVRADQYLAELDPEPPDAEAIAARWEAANDKVIAGVEVEVSEGRFEAWLETGGELPGDERFVKVYAEDGDRDAFGYAEGP